jgi:hypothetical protein
LYDAPKIVLKKLTEQLHAIDQQQPTLIFLYEAPKIVLKKAHRATT